MLPRTAEVNYINLMKESIVAIFGCRLFLFFNGFGSRGQGNGLAETELTSSREREHSRDMIYRPSP